jgi:hypothetical protein
MRSGGDRSMAEMSMGFYRTVRGPVRLGLGGHKQRFCAHRRHEDTKKERRMVGASEVRAAGRIVQRMQLNGIGSP